MKNMDPFKNTITHIINQINIVDEEIKSIYSNINWINEYLIEESEWQSRKESYIKQIIPKFALYTGLVLDLKNVAEDTNYASVLMQMRLRNELEGNILSLIG